MPAEAGFPILHVSMLQIPNLHILKIQIGNAKSLAVSSLTNINYTGSTKFLKTVLCDKPLAVHPTPADRFPQIYKL